MTKIAALIFDMDGLLVDSEPLAHRAMEKFLAAHGREIVPEVQQQLLGRRLPDAMAIVKAGYDLPESVEELTTEYGQRRLDEIRGNLRRMPGVEELLTFARQNGLSIALATSAMRSHADVSLEESDLAGLFDAEVTGDEVERGKPAPDLFLHAAGKLGVRPEQCVVFEDAPNGVAAARAAGMQVIAIPNETSRQHTFDIAPDTTFDRLDAAIPWLTTRLAQSGQ